MNEKKFEPGPNESRRIMKNIVVIGVAIMMLFTAYGGAANLQTSINAEAGLGTASLSAVYAGRTFSNIFLNACFTKWAGTKWTISLSMLTFVPWMACQMWPRFYTMIPAALVLGLGAGPLWCSQSTYMAVLSEAYSQISKTPVSAVFTRFVGLFYMIFNLNQVWGNLISSLVISSGQNAAALTAVNASLIPEVCGANFLPSADSEQALQRQPVEKIQMISGIFIALMAIAFLIVAVGVDSMNRYKGVREKSGSQSNGALITSTLKLVAEPNQALIILINIFNGYEQAFFGTDFTSAFVSCAIGTGSVGYVMLTYGIVSTVGCLIFGYITKLTGRLPLISLAAAVHTLLFVTLLTWHPQAHQHWVIYVIAVVWGLIDPIWSIQLAELCKSLFPGREEAAFSNLGLWMSAGSIVSYVLASHFRTSTKIYIMLVCLVVGMGMYYVVEYRDRRSKKMAEKRKNNQEKREKVYWSREHGLRDN